MTTHPWPLRLTYPEQTYLRRLGQEWAPFVVCDCGAAGPLETLGWMGKCCGPCHDRSEAGEAAPARNGLASTVLPGRGQAVATLSFSRDGRRLLVAGTGSASAQVWDVVTGRRWGSIGFSRGGFALSPNGRLIAAPPPPRDVTPPGEEEPALWNVATGERARPLRLANASRVRVLALAFSPDGETVAGLSTVGPRWWDVATGEQRPLPETEATLHSCLAFSPDGGALAIGDNRGIDLLDLAGAGGKTRLEQAGLFDCSALAFSPSGQTLAVFSLGEVTLWGLPSRQRRASFSTGEDAVRIAFAPDGRCLATVGEALRFWSVNQPGELAAFQWHLRRMTALAFSPDGWWLATGAEDGVVKLWPWRAMLGGSIG